MGLIKTQDEIKILREGGKILAEILAKLADAARPGVSSAELDNIARKEIEFMKAEPAFLGYSLGAGFPIFPAALCVSVDSEIVHGIPSPDKIIQDGQIVGLDLGIKYKNLYTDSAVSVPIGNMSEEKQKLLVATRQALYAGIKQIRPGARIGDVANAIESVARKSGLGVIEDLVGHGVGHSVHEPPNVPNYGKPNTLQKLETGMVLAIEPMFTLGGSKVRFLDDHWTVVTADGSASAHFEHTVAVTEKGHMILTK